MTPDLKALQKQKRKNFTKATKRKVRERSGGTCEVYRVPHCMYPALPETCDRPGRDVDHITPDWAGGEATLENGAFLCGACHPIKTVVDNKNAKKSNRLQGKTGQSARRDRAKAKGTYRPIAGRGFNNSNKQKLPTKADRAALMEKYR